MDMLAVCHAVRRDADEVLRAFERELQRQPWLSLPPSHRINGLPDVVLALIEASLCDPADIEAHRREVWAAAEHGQQRRDDGLSESVVFQEYHLLRRALWEYIEANCDDRHAALEAITRIDTAITLATMASLRGYHQQEIEARGDWPAAVERLVEESPFLRLRA